MLLYGLIGLLVWPTEETERDGTSAGAGLIGERGGLIVWSLLWAGAAALWCLSVNRAADATSEALKAASGNSMHWLASLQSSLARSTAGHGEAIAVVLAVLSLAIGGGRMDPLSQGGVAARGAALDRLLGTRTEPRRAEHRQGHRPQCRPVVRAASRSRCCPGGV